MVKSYRLQSMSLFVPAMFLEFQPAFLLAGGGVHPAISKAFNLALFLGFLYFVLRKPAAKFFNERKAQVRETLERAAREKDAATAKMAELDQRLNRLGDEISGIKTQAQREAAAERQRIEAETKRDMEKLSVAAQREIEASKQIAVADLREFAASKAVELAEQMIRSELTPEDDARMVQRVGEQLSRVK